MSEPFAGEIRMFAGNFAPRGWAFCSGQLLAVNQNAALFSLFGTIYGGDGRTTFGLPDLRGRIPIHAGHGPGLTPQALGSKSGSEKETLTVQQLPAHNHSYQATSQDAGTETPTNGLFAKSEVRTYFGDFNAAPMNSKAVANTGGSQSHDNIMPYLCINFIVALFGIYPPRN